MFLYKSLAAPLIFLFTITQAIAATSSKKKAPLQQIEVNLGLLSHWSLLSIGLGYNFNDYHGIQMGMGCIPPLMFCTISATYRYANNVSQGYNFGLETGVIEPLYGISVMPILHYNGSSGLKLDHGFGVFALVDYQGSRLSYDIMLVRIGWAF